MEYRKLIKFGNSSYIVSLPKTWIERHKLRKGDSLHLDVNGNGELMIAPKLVESTKEKKGITIDADNKDIFYIKREIVSAYINNYHNIVITGDDLSEKALGMREILNELVALEIMEQTGKRISAKDFLDMDNISIQNILRKIDMIVRSALYDIKTLAKQRKKSADIANSRDKDINRLTILALRTIRYGMNNSAFIKNNKLSPHELLDLYLCANFLEQIADEAKRTARILDHIIDEHINEPGASEFYDQLIDYFIQIEEMYVTAMKSFYKKDRYIAFDLATKRAKLKSSLDNLSHKIVHELKRSNRVVEKLASMLNHVHGITRICYQG